MTKNMRTKHIKRSDLARALLQALLQQPTRQPLKAVRLVIEAAIKSGELLPSSTNPNEYDLRDLIGFARNRKWKNTLSNLNTLCKHCRIHHNASVRIRTQCAGKTSSRPRKTARRVVRKAPEAMPSMSATLGITRIFIDEQVYPKGKPELISLAKKQAIEIDRLKGEIAQLRALLPK